MTPMNLDELRAIAEKATKGEWYWLMVCNELMALTDGKGNRLLMAQNGHDYGDGDVDPANLEIAEADRDHIATFHPALVLDLLALAREREQLVGALREARKHVWGLYLNDKDKFCKLLDRIDDALPAPTQEDPRP